MSDPKDVLRSLSEGTRSHLRTKRARLEIKGPDRDKFLHNLTTNDVKGLAVGRGHETFVTTPQGKTLSYGTVLKLEDRLLYRTEAAGLEALLAHFGKYGMFDDVEVVDRTAATFELHVAGAGARQPDGAAPDREFDHRLTQPDGDFLLIRERPLGVPGWTLIGPVDQLQSALDRTSAELRGRFEPLDPDDAESLRIMTGTPLFGRDVTTDNLPQEVGRDARAISFVKGCYLGQETVARLDALGHVNRLLTRLSLDSGAVPADGTPLFFEGKQVGKITSAESGGAFALGYVRAQLAVAGTKLVVGDPNASRRATCGSDS